MIPIDRVPRVRPSTPATASRAAVAAASTRRASGSRALPDSVSATRRVVRSKSRVPSSPSSARIEADSPDCTMFDRSAARLKCSSSAAATKCSSWRISIYLSLSVLSQIVDFCCGDYRAGGSCVHRTITDRRHTMRTKTSGRTGVAAQERIAVLGTGVMGAPIARNLLAAGFPVTVWNRTRGRAEALVADGAQLAPTPRAAAASAGIVLTMLADGAAAADTIDGPEGAAHALAPGSIWIQMGTVGVDWTERLAQIAEAH